MKKIGILTINGHNNYGNRLQNFALQYFLEKSGYKVDTIYNMKGVYSTNKKTILKYNLKNNIKCLLPMKKYRRFKSFYNFDKKYVNISKIKIDPEHIYPNLERYYDFFISGSDQVWNPYFSRMSNIDLILFAPKEKRVSYAASFGVSELPDDIRPDLKQCFDAFKAISVREEKAKEIIELFSNRKDTKVVLDPTMLLTSKEWEKVSKKPKKLPRKKYILNYFLGDLKEENKIQIEKTAEQYDCEIINILDPKSLYYSCGPSEFLYLENNAFLICTDSFHSCVFAFLFNVPFIIFDREQDGMVSMNSRIETLLDTFKLKNRKFEGSISKENIEINYKTGYEILEKKREEASNFLERALDINK